MEEPRNQKSCKYCSQDIDATAKVCHCCGRHQRWFIQYFGNFGLIVTFGLLIITILHFWEARQERIAASEAMNKASDAIKDARRVQCDLVRVGHDLLNITNNIYYNMSRYVAQTSKDRKVIFGRIEELRERLKNEHSNAQCPPIPPFPLKRWPEFGN